VREARGNTGSKTTIHRYLRELEVEEGGQRAPVRDAILALVSRLAARLEEEAATQVESMRIQIGEQQAADSRVRSDLEAQLAEARQARDAVCGQLESSRQQTVRVNDLLNHEQIARHTAEQRAVGLGERLADALRHQTSLEEKHEHARSALEHYRGASKEQRELETRRHEQQVQALQSDVRQAQLAVSVKQEELTRLNKEAAALATELRAAKQALHEQRETSRALVRKVEQLQGLETVSSSLIRSLPRAGHVLRRPNRPRHARDSFAKNCDIKMRRCRASWLTRNRRRSWKRAWPSWTMRYSVRGIPSPITGHPASPTGIEIQAWHMGIGPRRVARAYDVGHRRSDHRDNERAR
jgi:hypothetical protein